MAAVNATPHGGPPHPDGAPGHDLEALAALAASVLWGGEQPARPDPARPDPARSEVFRTQSFIRLGGDSLRAMHLSALALDRLGVTMPLAPLMSDEPLSVALSRATPPAGGVGGAPTAPAAPSTTPSPIQQGMWAAERVMGGAPYNLVFLAFIEGPLHPDLLRQAIGRTVARHEGLRTCFPETDGGLQRRVEESFQAPVVTFPTTAAEPGSPTSSAPRRPSTAAGPWTPHPRRRSASCSPRTEPTTTHWS